MSTGYQLGQLKTAVILYHWIGFRMMTKDFLCTVFENALRNNKVYDFNFICMSVVSYNRPIQLKYKKN